MNEALKNKPGVVHKVVIAWQFFLLILFPWLGWNIRGWTPPDIVNWIRPVGVALCVFETLLVLVSLFFILRRQAAGRMLALLTHYSAFIFFFAAVIQIYDIALLIDIIANHLFRAGIPLLGIFAGYLIHYLTHRSPGEPSGRSLRGSLGKWVAILSLCFFLYFGGVIDWIGNMGLSLRDPLQIGLITGTILLGCTSWMLSRPAVGKVYRAPLKQDEAISGFLFLSPNLFGFLIFFAAPLLFSLFLSFTEWDSFGTPNWIGMANYQELFNLTIQPLLSQDQPATEAINFSIYNELTRFSILGKSFIIGAEDKLFWIALKNTLIFSLLTVPLSVIPAIGLATILNSKIPGMKLFRAVYFVPSIAAVVGVAIIWQWLYNAAVGYINYAITLVVNLLNKLPFVAVVDPHIRWLSDSQTALLAIVIMSAWQIVGFNTVLFLAGLQGIPGELYEAATVDGAGSWKKFTKITLPLLRPTTFFVVATTSIQTLKVFEQVYIATEPPGGPSNSTLTVVLHLYQMGFQSFKHGYASATAWVLFAIIFVITLLQYWRQSQPEV